ncbi:MAG TPA: class I SAM-dependent methyltransferase [Rudaea sp.]|nr:class I SAM-dependent methyltransferase [Rudaea sp.]
MSEHFDQDIRYHAAIAHEYDTVITQPRAFPNDLLFGALDPLIVPGARMLDLGCGTGQMLLRYARRFGAAIGVDHSPQMLAEARANLDHQGLSAVKLRQTDLNEFLAGDEGHYDLITCVGCLHHFPHADIPKALIALSRRLAPSGAFLFAEPIDVPIETLPAEIASWNAGSVMRGRGYSSPAEDPDEGPLPLTLLHEGLAGAKLRVIAESRGWEMFPHQLPPSLADRIALWQMHHRYGANGNIYSAVAFRTADL